MPTKYLRYYLIIPLGVIILFWIGWWIMVISSDGTDLEVQGQIGDFFGSLTSLFTGLALVALALNFIQLKRQVKIQQDEIEKSNTSNKEQQKRHLESIRQNARIAMISNYGRKLDELEARLKNTRNPSLVSEFEITQENYYNILSELELDSELVDTNNEKFPSR